VILLPFLCWLAWAFAFRRAGRSPLEAGLAALIVFGVTTSLATELQSLAGMLTPAGSALAWTIAAGAGLVLARRPRPGAPAAGEATAHHGLLDWAPIVLFLGLTAVVALVSAPNSYDGFTYHLTRVETWIQQGSVRPFATHDTRQLFMPSWSEYAILQLRLLSGGDHFANLVQWLGFAGTMGGAALLARGLGGGRLAAVAAAALVATLPQAVAQASGTQTDVIAACWAVLTCAFGYRLLAADGRAGDAVLAALALGLAAATKQTAALFGGMALLPAIGLLAWRGKWRRAAAWGAGIGLAVAAMTGPQLGRNREVFGELRGDTGWLGTVVMQSKAPNQVFGNALRNLSVHFGTPSPAVNDAVMHAAAGLSRLAGADPNDRRTTWHPPFVTYGWTTHEEAAGNPLHLLLIAGCLLGLARWRPGAVRGLFLAALLGGFVWFCATLKWQNYASRLHTPLFALALAWVGVVLEHMPDRGRRGLIWLLAVAALPTALFNYTRPLLALPGGAITPRPSILSVPRALQYFFYMPPLAEAYRDVAVRITASGCTDVGVRAWPDAWEYPVRALARDAGSGARFRSVDVQNVSARFARTGPAPCLLLELGPGAGKLPDWALSWQPVADWHDRFVRAGLGAWAIALYRPGA
jgi:hypothetical protein